jgi:hypothetical protein
MERLSRYGILIARVMSEVRQAKPGVLVRATLTIIHKT